MTDQAHPGHVHRVKYLHAQTHDNPDGSDWCPDCIAREQPVKELAAALEAWVEADNDDDNDEAEIQEIIEQARTALARYRGES